MKQGFAQLARAGGLCLGVLGIGLFFATTPAQAFIETKLPLEQLIGGDSDHIFVAKVAKIDAANSRALFKVETDLKGKAPFRELPIHLTGNERKHTPELLKRIAVDLAIVVFVIEKDGQQLGLAFTNGTWFQIIGTGKEKIVWTFTHCEIYLRRTFKGTTAELRQTVEEVLAGKRKAPPYDAKEKPGFGPELEMKPEKGDGRAGGASPPVIATTYRGVGTPHSPISLGIVALPVLAPLAALFQLLFPGLLREQWRQYKIGVYILLTATTFVFLHFATGKWFAPQSSWVADQVVWEWTLNGTLIAVAVVGAVLATIDYVQRTDTPLPSVLRPHTVEYVALGLLAAGGGVWAIIHKFANEQSLFDDWVTWVTVAAFVAIGHVVYRSCWYASVPLAVAIPGMPWADASKAAESRRRPLLPTQLVFMCSFAVVGSAAGLYLLLAPEPPNFRVDDATGTEWHTCRGNVRRTGCLNPNDPGPSRPRILWSLDLIETVSRGRGRITTDSAPTVYGNQVYFGAMHQVQTIIRGYFYCVNAEDGQVIQGTPLAAGQPIWRFSAKDTLRPVFSSPSIVKGRIYVGEGYHQDQVCRLFCLDVAGEGQTPRWAKRTRSHVESSPAVVGNRVYFGAGDDGIICVDADDLESVPNEPWLSPKTIWQVGRIHVDTSPLVVGKRLFTGSVVGDLYQDLYMVAVDVETGQYAWRIDAPLPVPASPSYAEWDMNGKKVGHVFFGMGNGKVNLDDDNPAGAVWCVEAETGRRVWTFPEQGFLPNAVNGAMALMGENVYFGCRDGNIYCVRQRDGKLVWRMPMGSPIVAAPVVAGGKVYVAATSGALACFDGQTGRTLWTFDDLKEHADDSLYANPILAGGRLYLGAGGKLFCIGDK